MKNNIHNTEAWLTRAVDVPAATLSGDIVTLGTDGLLGIALTAAVTAADLADFSKVIPQGLLVNQATVILMGVTTDITLNVPGVSALFKAVYRVPGTGVLSFTSAVGSDLIGYWLSSNIAGGVGPVALIQPRRI